MPVFAFWSPRLLLSCCFVLAIACRYSNFAVKPARLEARPASEWEAAFRIPQSLFRGADACYSVPLGPDRTLWLFGDSWIVDPNVEGREGGRLIRNTLAIQRIGQPVPAQPEFYWRTDPKSEAPGHAFDSIPATAPPGWIWPLSGLRLGGTLALFTSELIHSDEGLGFESSKNLLTIVPNPDEPMSAWRFEHHEIPFFTHSRRGDRAFGCASLISNLDGDEFVYVYGIREDWLRGPGGRGFIVARASREAVARADFDSWTFFTGSAWEPSVEKAKELFAGAATEMSVSYVPAIERFVAIYTPSGLSPEIHARFAFRPEGPWSDSVLIYTAPDAGWSKRYFCYAAKAHPELTSDPFELILTYAANSMELGDHFKDARLYWPRFVRVRLEPRPAGKP